MLKSSSIWTCRNQPEELKGNIGWDRWEECEMKDGLKEKGEENSCIKYDKRFAKGYVEAFLKRQIWTKYKLYWIDLNQSKKCQKETESDEIRTKISRDWLYW